MNPKFPIQANDGTQQVDISVLNVPGGAIGENGAVDLSGGIQYPDPSPTAIPRVALDGSLENSSISDDGGGVVIDGTVEVSEFPFITGTLEFLGTTISEDIPNLTNFPDAGTWGFHWNSDTSTLYLAYNFSGVVRYVAMT